MGAEPCTEPTRDGWPRSALPTPQPSWALLTCFAVHSKVLLALQHTVDYPGTAPIRGVIGIGCHYLHHRGACSRDKE